MEHIHERPRLRATNSPRLRTPGEEGEEALMGTRRRRARSAACNGVQRSGWDTELGGEGEELSYANNAMDLSEHAYIGTDDPNVRQKSR